MMDISEQEDVIEDAQRYRLLKNMYDNLNGTIHYAQLYILLASILNPSQMRPVLESYPDVLLGIPEGTLNNLLAYQQHQELLSLSCSMSPIIS